VSVIEIRTNDDGSIDEIIARDCTMYIEQLSDNDWFLGIEAADGSYWQFWFGARNGKSFVDVKQTEMVPAEEYNS